eukprot:1316968-Amphidinium_carterae.1
MAVAAVGKSTTLNIGRARKLELVGDTADHSWVCVYDGIRFYAQWLNSQSCSAYNSVPSVMAVAGISIAAAVFSVAMAALRDSRS